jgi:hypothetical protein
VKLNKEVFESHNTDYYQKRKRPAYFEKIEEVLSDSDEFNYLNRNPKSKRCSI